MVLAGLFATCHMLLLWRNVLGVPWELSVAAHMNDQGSPVRPWAPWWVPACIMALLAMLLWRAFAARRERILAWRGALVFALIALLGFPVAFLCLNLGATAQYYPRPSVDHVLLILPMMVVSSLGGGLMVIASVGNYISLPIAALFGAVNAGIGKLVLRIGRRRSQQIA
ncbi:MAG: hypothetical protein K2Z80_07900 [Xanthobacteraceae bacterium]|nr:hypothetical protein [Xanthobacteraceae bacterium]